jgi:hypothetical protein
MRPIPGFPGYQITTDGRVWSEPKTTSHKKGKWLKPCITNGYVYAGLYQNGKCFDRRVHRLVLETYVGPCPKGMEACHNNGDRRDNRLENLRWGTRSANIYDAVKHGTHVNNQGEKNSQAKLTEDQVRLIYASYHNGLHTIKELTDYFNVSEGCIWGIVRKVNWKHLWKAAAA